MSTAVFLADDLLEKAEALARRTRRSRDEVIRDAVGNYLAAYDPDAVTAAMNAVIDECGQPDTTPLAREASRRVLEQTEW